jgi:hypothetical protein
MTTVRGRECGWCEGQGEVQVGAMSTNPYSGVPVLDPELDAYARCWHCDGTGVIARTSAMKKEQG